MSIETARSHVDGSELQGLDGKRVIAGDVDLADRRVESVHTIVEPVQRARPCVERANVMLAPDCGVKSRPPELTTAKLPAMVEAA